MPKPKLNRKCEIADCESPHHARGFCMRHYSKTEFKKLSNKAYRKRNPDKLRVWKCAQQQRFRKRYPEIMKERAWKYGAKHRAVISEGVSRYGWIDRRLISNFYTKICGICARPITSSYEIDHIIPLARNGTHTLENLQLAHPLCNRTKNDRLQKDIGIDIMLLRELINY